MRALFCLYITAYSAICSQNNKSFNKTVYPQNDSKPLLSNVLHPTQSPSESFDYRNTNSKNNKMLSFENLTPPLHIIEWSKEQKNALLTIQEAYKKILANSPFVVVISGKTGTGKTTLLKKILEQVRIYKEETVLFEPKNEDDMEKWQNDCFLKKKCFFIDNYLIHPFLLTRLEGFHLIFMTSDKKITDDALKLSENEVRKLEQICCQVDLGEKSFRPTLTAIEYKGEKNQKSSKDKDTLKENDAEDNQDKKKKEAVKRLFRKLAPTTVNVFDELQKEQKNEVEKTKEEPPVYEKPSYQSLFQGVTKTIRRQDLAIKDILNATFAHLAYCEGNYNKPARILLHGPSGCGKTAIMNRISENIGWPFFNINASEITGAGYKGQNLEEKISSIMSECENEKKDYNRVIIFFDEIDKLLGLSAGERAPGAAINELLTFMEHGITVKQKKGFSEKTVHFSTKDCILLFAGAFNQIKLEDARRYFPEFFGRIFSEIGIAKLKKEDFKDILLTSEESSYVAMKKKFEENGRTLTLEKGVDDYLAEYAFKRGTGTRALQEAMNKLLTPYFGEKAEEKNILVTLRECKELFDSYMKPDYPSHLYL